MSRNEVNVLSQRNQRRQLRQIKIIERQTRNNFILFELGFIFIIITLLVIAFVMGPILYYYAITQEFHLWPFYIVGGMVAFFEIVGIQYFIKRYYLDAHNMTFGEFLRFKFNSQFRYTKEETEGEGHLSWYKDLDEFINNIRIARKEKTDRLYAAAYNHIDFNDDRIHS